MTLAHLAVSAVIRSANSADVPPTGTAPKTLSASAFGPYAVQDMAYVQWTGASGRAVFHVYPNGPVQWTVFDFTRSYATDQVAAQAIGNRTRLRSLEIGCEGGALSGRGVTAPGA